MAAHARRGGAAKKRLLTGTASGVAPASEVAKPYYRTRPPALRDEASLAGLLPKPRNALGPRSQPVRNRKEEVA